MSCVGCGGTHAVGRVMLGCKWPGRRQGVWNEGGIHDGNQGGDEVRPTCLAAIGYKVVPVRTEEIDTNLSAVLKVIRDLIKPNKDNID